MAARSESEVIAQEVSVLKGKIEALQRRLDDVDKVIARLEGAALTTARSLQEISAHWDAVYEAMRRPEEPDVGQLRGGSESSLASRRKR
jgi:predicted nuclease with TOPRIM domain